MVDQIPFKTGDKVTSHITVCSDANERIPAAEIQGVASITSDTTSASYTIPWSGVLDAVTEGSIVALYTLTPPTAARPRPRRKPSSATPVSSPTLLLNSPG
ncbi:hypothetical protein OV450_3718 [Actinobacteria bacterium OV450]|nr:hypothetical protein OV450_3718 [Actinobacteria bacterium OV450]